MSKPMCIAKTVLKRTFMTGAYNQNVSNHFSNKASQGLSKKSRRLPVFTLLLLQPWPFSVVFSGLVAPVSLRWPPGSFAHLTL